MKRILLISSTTLFLSQAALAESHTPNARSATLAKLQENISFICPKENTDHRCGELILLVGQLYKNPKVATEEDLRTLENISKLASDISPNQKDIMLAITRTRKLYAHVVIDHKGVWG